MYTISSRFVLSILSWVDCLCSSRYYNRDQIHEGTTTLTHVWVLQQQHEGATTQIRHMRVLQHWHTSGYCNNNTEVLQHRSDTWGYYNTDTRLGTTTTTRRYYTSTHVWVLQQQHEGTTTQIRHMRVLQHWHTSGYCNNNTEVLQHRHTSGYYNNNTKVLQHRSDTWGYYNIDMRLDTTTGNPVLIISSKSGLSFLKCTVLLTYSYKLLRTVNSPIFLEDFQEKNIPHL